VANSRSSSSSGDEDDRNDDSRRRHVAFKERLRPDAFKAPIYGAEINPAAVISRDLAGNAGIRKWQN